MRQKLLGTILLGLSGIVLLNGCVAVPAQGPVVYEPPSTADEEAPPAEYVVGGVPVYYEAVYPGVAFYPIFIAGCDCVVPVRYHRGVWVDVDGRQWHHGYLVYRQAPAHAVVRWREHGHVSAAGYRAVIGPAREHSVVHPAGRPAVRQGDVPRQPTGGQPAVQPTPRAPAVQPTAGPPAVKPSDGDQM
jgi:hypothetical protein